MCMSETLKANEKLHGYFCVVQQKFQGRVFFWGGGDEKWEHMNFLCLALQRFACFIFSSRISTSAEEEQLHVTELV